MQAMILAAGLGTRLRPYSLIKPKPLFPVLGTPLLFLTIGALRRAGCRRIVVNAHHLREQIREALAGEDDIILQEEEQILGTGGGLRRALRHFNSEPVLVVNGDIYHTVDLRKIYQSHLAGGAHATMVLHDFPRFNSVTVDNDCVTGFAAAGSMPPPGQRTLAFTGIHVINPEILHPIAATGFSDIIARYRECIGQGLPIRAEIVASHFWTDMGTPADYLDLHRGLLAGQIPACAELAHAVRQAPFYLGKGIEKGKNVHFIDWVSIGDNVTIKDNATVRRAVVWDNAVIPENADISNAIVPAGP